MSAGPVPRLVTVWCPDWSVLALVVAGEVAPDAPVVVVRANRVLARSRAAAFDGVRVGMRRREAQSACPHVVVVDHDPARDSRAFEPLLRAVCDLVPLVEVSAPGRLSFATRGPSRYLGGDAPLADRVAAIVGEALGPASEAAAPPGVGVADGRFAAAIAARWSQSTGTPVVVPTGRTATSAFLGPRSIGTLVDAGGVAPDLVDLLRRMGLSRLGDIAALPPADLLARFGPSGRLLHLLATGADESPPATAPPPLDLTVTQVFDEPIGQVQALVFAAKSLADALGADLSRRGLVCTRLLVEIETDAGERSCRGWYRPSGLSAAAIVERVRWQLEGWTAAVPVGAAGDSGGDSGDVVVGGPTSGVVLVRLVPDEVRADDGVQAGFWGGRTQADDWAGRAVARLSGLLGAEAVTVAEWRGGRDPQQAFVLVPASSTDLAERSGNVVPATRSGPWPGRLPAPSPAVIHPTPVPVEVVDASGRPVTVSGRGMISAAPSRVVTESGAARVVGWAGPWPVEERWWDARSRRAARFQVTARDVRGVVRAHLIEVRDSRWWIVAEYA